MLLLLLPLLIAYTQNVASLQTCSNMTIAVTNVYTLANATYAPNQDCTFVVQFDKDTAVLAWLTVTNMDNSSSARVWNDYGNSFSDDKAEHAFSSNVYWPPSVLYIRLRTGSAQALSMKLELTPRKIQLGVNSTAARLTTGQQPLVYETMKENWTYTFQSATRVAVSAAFFQDAYLQYFMSYFIYEGNGTNNYKFIGTLYNFVNGRNYISSGQFLTIYPVGEILGPGWGKIIVNDYANVAAFNGNSHYCWSYFSGNSIYQQKTLDATKAPASLSIVNYQYTNDRFQDYPFLVDIQFSNSSSTLTAFAGLPTSNMSSFYITEYPALDSASRLSQLFPGTMLTLVLDKGTATVNFTALSYNSASDWGVAKARKGVFISNGYGFPSNTTKTMNYAFFQAYNHNDTINLKLQVGHDFVANNSMLSYWAANSTNAIGQKWSLSKPSAMNISVVGRNFKVDMNPGDPKSHGLIVHFEMDYVNQRNGSPMLHVLFAALMTFLLS